MCWTLSSGSISPEYPLPWLPEQVVVRPRLYLCLEDSSTISLAFSGVYQTQRSPLVSGLGKLWFWGEDLHLLG